MTLDLSPGQVYYVHKYKEKWKIIGLSDGFINFEVVEGKIVGTKVNHYDVKEFMEMIKASQS